MHSFNNPDDTYMIYRLIKPLCWLIASMSLIYSFTVEGPIDPSFYRSISIVFFIATLAIHKKDTEISLSINRENKPAAMQTKTLSLDIESILRDKQNGAIEAYRKNNQQRGL